MTSLIGRCGLRFSGTNPKLKTRHGEARSHLLQAYAAVILTAPTASRVRIFRRWLIFRHLSPLVRGGFMALPCARGIARGLLLFAPLGLRCCTNPKLKTRHCER